MMFLYFLEKQSKEKMDFKYGYHPSQIPPYSLADSKRFLKIIFPAIRTVFQFIVIIFKSFDILSFNDKINYNSNILGKN